VHRLVGGAVEGAVLAGPAELAAEIACISRKDWPTTTHHLVVLAAETPQHALRTATRFRFLRHALTLVPHAAVEHRGRARAQLFDASVALSTGSARWSSARGRTRPKPRAGAERAAVGPSERPELLIPFGLIDPDRGIAAAEEAVALSAGLGIPASTRAPSFSPAGSPALYEPWRGDDWQTCESARRTLER